jgi:hypothetical protein
MKDLITVQHLLTELEYQNVCMSEETLEDYIKHMLAIELAQFVFQNFDYEQGSVEGLKSFKLQVAVLTPKRYKQLMDAEYRLDKLEW